MTYAEIHAWAMLTERRPQPHEVDTLLTMDAAMRAEMHSDG